MPTWSRPMGLMPNLLPPSGITPEAARARGVWGWQPPYSSVVKERGSFSGVPWWRWLLAGFCGAALVR